MHRSKATFRILAVLTCAVFLLLLVVACSSATPTPGTPPPTPAYMACEHYNSFDAARAVWLQHYVSLRSEGVAVNLNNLWDENGEWIDGVYGIVIRNWTMQIDGYRDRGEHEVTTLRCLEGVPVQTVYDSLFQDPYNPDPTPVPTVRANTFILPECADSNATEERVEEVFDKYESLLRSYPNSIYQGAGAFRDLHPYSLNPRGIVITIYPWVDPDSLPEEQRIPDCLEGIPVQIVEGSPSTVRANTFTAPECTDNLTGNRVHEVFQKYASLILSYPNSTFHSIGSFWSKYGRPTKAWGIVITIYPWVDPDSLPEEQRIPDCLEGIPVQIVEGSVTQYL